MSPLMYEVRNGLMIAVKPLVISTYDMRNVSVDFQYPLDDTEVAESIWTQNARYEIEPASLGQGRTKSDEVGRFDVCIKSNRPATNAKDAATRVRDFAQIVVEAVGDRRNNELGITGLQTLTVDGAGTVAETKGDHTIVGWFTVPIRYTARLT